MEDKEPNLKEKVDELYDLIKSNPKLTKKRNIRIPKKAKVKSRKIRKGWVGILKIDENGNISGERQKIEGSAYNLSSNTYHATEGNNGSEGQEILFWNGKYPVIIQETKKKNPVRFNSGKNETFGQKYIMSLMAKDQLDKKKKLGGNGFLIWIIVAAVGFFIIKSLIDKGGV